MVILPLTSWCLVELPYSPANWVQTLLHTPIPPTTIGCHGQEGSATRPCTRTCRRGFLRPCPAPCSQCCRCPKTRLRSWWYCPLSPPPIQLPTTSLTSLSFCNFPYPSPSTSSPSWSIFLSSIHLYPSGLVSPAVLIASLGA
ncbi:hypothetical protein JZ751_016684 [Albula glossodonta]|uniref:Uncharacterized protein n=1 Tax=Albula glossodonta TaxID=121402 RepID=A0A8T2N0G2_9TELE|nr:hypothetical protein JZ751_016684 [Albula glossodonta]